MPLRPLYYLYLLVSLTLGVGPGSAFPAYGKALVTRAERVRGVFLSRPTALQLPLVHSFLYWSCGQPK